MAPEDDKLHEGDAGTTTTKTVEKTSTNENGADAGGEPQEKPEKDSGSKDSAKGEDAE